MIDNEKVARRALEIADELRRALPPNTDFGDGWQQRYMERQNERFEKALDMARQEAVAGAATGSPVTDSRCNYVTSGAERICNKCRRKHDGGSNPAVPLGVTTCAGSCCDCGKGCAAAIRQAPEPGEGG